MKNKTVEQHEKEKHSGTPITVEGLFATIFVVGLFVLVGWITYCAWFGYDDGYTDGYIKACSDIGKPCDCIGNGCEVTPEIDVKFSPSQH